ncbi:MAG: asparagine synthase-related protein, partial [Solirubrobacteraceae bacterium]|nr:asparagine synthase-related protein [Patulibacter sp.]
MHAGPIDPMKPSADEICVAMLGGQVPGMAPLDLRRAPSDGPRLAIERLLRGAFERGPVWVAFSGGRDSSALLAIAAHVARTDGFDSPIPVTMVFPEVSDTDEEGWQRLVLERLGLLEAWVRLEPGEDLDMIGPYAQRVLRRHGVLVPPNAHAGLPMLDAMGGHGTLVSGAGGDELMEGRPQRLTSAIWSRRRVRANELTGCVVDDLSGALQRRAIRRTTFLHHFHWLAPATWHRRVAEEIEERSVAPIRFDSLLRRAFTDRHFRAADHAYGLLAGDLGVDVLMPFVEREVVGAFAASWGYRFPGERARSLRPLVGDLLPEELITRESKAE